MSAATPRRQVSTGLPADSFAVFPDLASAMRGVASIKADLSHSSSGRPSLLSSLDRLRSSGAMHTSASRAQLISIDASATQRESSVYGYDECISPITRSYLCNRDTTIRLFVEGQALDAVSELPICPSSQDIDDGLHALSDLGLATALSQALAYSFRDGFAFVYIDAPGAIDAPIPAANPGSARSSITPNSFSVITAEQLVWPEPATYVQANTPETRDQLLRHGILSLTVDFSRPATYDWSNALYSPASPSIFGGVSQSAPSPGQVSAPPSAPDSHNSTIRQIHGHRIYPITPDTLAKSFMGRSLIDIIYDDLRNLRDVKFAQSAAQLQGDPIVLEVNTKEGFRLDDVDAETIAADMQEFSDGQRDAFSPLYGITIKRLGPVSLPDPEATIRLLASTLSHACALPVNKILASSRGSEQATPEDRNDYETGLNRRYRRPRLEPVIRHCLRILSRGGQLARRPTNASIPRLHWADNRVVAPDTAALIQKNRSVTMANALKAGRLPPRDILEEFLPNLTIIDPKYVLGSRRLPFNINPDGTPIPEPLVNVNEEIDPSSDIVDDDEGDSPPQAIAPAKKVPPNARP